MEVARLGADVTLVARNEESLERVRAELPGGDRQSHHHVCADFDDPDALKHAVET